jgi:hypothetical protein
VPRFAGAGAGAGLPSLPASFAAAGAAGTGATLREDQLGTTCFRLRGAAQQA